MPLQKIGPHVIVPTRQALAWAARSHVVKAKDAVAALEVAPAHALRIFRHGFRQQNLFANAAHVVGELLNALAGYRHPNLYVEVYNEIPKELTAQHADLLEEVVPLLHAAGLKVIGPCWSTGDYEAESWEEMRRRGWCGLDAVAVHCYWGMPHGLPEHEVFTPWNALRYRQFRRPGDPPVLITECGRDQVNDLPGSRPTGNRGWKNDGISAEAFVAELEAYERYLQEDDYVLGATVFTAGASDDWRAFDTDDISHMFAIDPSPWSAPEPPPTPPTPPDPPTPPTPPLGGGLGALKALAQAAAARHGLDWPLLDRQVQAESSWNPRAVSTSGAKGLMQLMDGTARDLGVADPFDPAQNLEGGCRFMAFLLKKYGRSYRRALVAYNWGPGNLDRLLATNPPDWTAGISEQAKRYLAKIQPPPDPQEPPMADIDLSDIPVEEMLSATHFDRGRAKTDLVVIHATRSGGEPNSISQEANGTAVWMNRDDIPVDDRVSSHLVVGDAKVYRVVRDADTAWHAGYLNDRSVGIEVAQDQSTTPFHPRQYEFAAKATARYCAKYGIPVRRVRAETERGIIGHEDTGQGRSFGKSDPGRMWDWDRFMALVRQHAGVAEPDPPPVDPPIDPVDDALNGVYHYLAEAERSVEEARERVRRLKVALGRP